MVRGCGSSSGRGCGSSSGGSSSASSSVSVVNCGVNVEGQYFMSFEYAPYDLRAIMQSADVPLSPLHVALVIYQLLKALAYCHQRSIVHCNVKPSSILLAAK